LTPGVESISPLVLSITGFNVSGVPTEIPEIREAVDAMLAAEGRRDIENVAFTIFPQRYWQMANGCRKEFFDMFREAFPRIQEFNRKNNGRGSYFQRLIDFHNDGGSLDQLDWILREYKRNPSSRRSKWQATTFDPARDLLTTSQLEFPCLQQVSFSFEAKQGLVLNAFYATQQIARKGYGNYLGLCRLGAFMASQMDRKLVRMNVFVGIAKMDMGKTDSNLIKMADDIRAVIGPTKLGNAA